MPVATKKIGNRWRTVEKSTGKIAKTKNGKPRDGGGFSNKKLAQAQVRAINSNA